jgi:hypothetical protein
MQKNESDSFTASHSQLALKFAPAVLNIILNSTYEVNKAPNLFRVDDKHTLVIMLLTDEKLDEFVNKEVIEGLIDISVEAEKEIQMFADEEEALEEKPVLERKNSLELEYLDNIANTD